jgi:hypothetical protein
LWANIVPSIATGSLAVLLVVPFIPGNLQDSLIDNRTWDYLERFEPVVLLAGMLSSIVLLWLNKEKTKKKKR